jgi:hypothetical protein
MLTYMLINCEIVNDYSIRLFVEMLAHNYDWGYSPEEASLGRRKKIQKTHFPKVLRAGMSF